MDSDSLFEKNFFSVCLRRGTFSFRFVKSTMWIMFTKALHRIFFFLSLKGALFLVASPPPACFMKMFFLCGNVSQYGIKLIYLAFIQLELFLLQKIP